MKSWLRPCVVVSGGWGEDLNSDPFYGYVQSSSNNKTHPDRRGRVARWVLSLALSKKSWLIKTNKTCDFKHIEPQCAILLSAFNHNHSLRLLSVYVLLVLLYVLWSKIEIFLDFSEFSMEEFFTNISIHILESRPVFLKLFYSNAPYSLSTRRFRLPRLIKQT